MRIFLSSLATVLIAQSAMASPEVDLSRVNKLFKNVKLPGGCEVVRLNLTQERENKFLDIKIVNSITGRDFQVAMKDYRLHNHEGVYVPSYVIDERGDVSVRTYESYYQEVDQETWDGPYTRAVDIEYKIDSATKEVTYVNIAYLQKDGMDWKYIGGMTCVDPVNERRERSERIR